MRHTVLASLLLAVALGLGSCGGGAGGGTSDVGGYVYAKVNWTADVTGLSMVDVGVADSELSNGGVYPLEYGQGTVYWTNSGTGYSRALNVGFSGGGEGDDVECEQEGEHEGENAGCMFALDFVGDTLSIHRIE